MFKSRVLPTVQDNTPKGVTLGVDVIPLTTEDECTCHATLAARYQLAQSILKIVKGC